MAKKTPWLMYVVVATIALLAIGVIKIGPTGVTFNGVPLSVGTSTTTSTSSSATTSSGAPCPNYAQNFQVTVAYPDYTKSPIVLTAVAGQTINGYAQSPSKVTIPSTTQQSSSSSANALTSVNCNTPYLLTAGDNSGYFLNGSVQNIGTNNNQQVTIVASKYSAVSISTANTVQATPSGTNAAIIASTKNSQTVTAYLVVQAGQYTASQGPMALSFSYNGVDIQSISIGVPQSGVPVPAYFISANTAQLTYNPGIGGTLATAFGAQSSQVTFLVPAVYNFLYSSGSGTAVSTQEIPVVITTSSTFGTGNELISVQVTPGTSFFNTTSGALMTGQFKNPQTGANIWTPVQFANAIVLKGAA